VKVSVLLRRRYRSWRGGGRIGKKDISKLDMSIWRLPGLGFLILKLQNTSKNLRHWKSLGGRIIFVKISEAPGEEYKKS